MNSHPPFIIAFMDPHQFAIFSCAVCGILMVVGSIWLLKTGVIRLTEAAKDGSLTISIADKVKVSTTYPALGLFIIGLAFVGMAIWFSMPKPGIPLNIVGKIDIDEPSAVTVSIQPDISATFKPDSDGQLDQMVRLEVRRFNVVINAAGYKPEPFTTTLKLEDAKGHKLAFDVVKFAKKPVPPPPTGDVLPVPENQKLEPLTKTN
jgi:hypothetical protein